MGTAAPAVACPLPPTAARLAQAMGTAVGSIPATSSSPQLPSAARLACAMGSVRCRSFVSSMRRPTRVRDGLCASPLLLVVRASSSRRLVSSARISSSSPSRRRSASRDLCCRLGCCSSLRLSSRISSSPPRRRSSARRLATSSLRWRGRGSDFAVAPFVAPVAACRVAAPRIHDIDLNVTSLPTALAFSARANARLAPLLAFCFALAC